MPENTNQMVGKVCLVTGATGGLGQATALGLAKMGATVIVVGRNRKKITHTLALIRRATGSKTVEGIQADLSVQSEIRRTAQLFLAKHNSLDLLVNNVGQQLLGYQESRDGIEMTWALNYLGHFLLTGLLLDALRAAAAANGEARILGITSSIYRLSRPRFDQRPERRSYNGILAYSLSKRAILTFTVELSRRLAGSGVAANAITPGLVNTDIANSNTLPFRLLMKAINRFALDVEKGAQPILYLASSPELCGASGVYYKKFRPMPADPSYAQAEIGRQLWQISEGAVGVNGGV